MFASERPWELRPEVSLCVYFPEILKKHTMKTRILIAFPLMLFILYSCNYQLRVNGKKTPFTKIRNSNDSILIFLSNDSVPPGSKLLSETKMCSPFLWLDAGANRPFFTMRDYARTEAKKQGANLVKITGITNVKSERYKVSMQMYLLPEPYLSDYKMKLDSTEEANKMALKELCTVHVKSFFNTHGTNVKCPVYLNDSLLINAEGFDRKNGILDVPAFNFKRGNSCILSLKNGSPEISLETGREYYFFIGMVNPYKNNGHFEIRTVSKATFENINFR